MLLVYPLQDETVSREELIAQSLTFLTAGHETTRYVSVPFQA